MEKKKAEKQGKAIYQVDGREWINGLGIIIKEKEKREEAYVECEHK